MKFDNLNPYVTGGLLGLLIIVAVSLLSSPGWAPQMIRVAVVNWEQVVANYEQFQQEISELESQRERLLEMIEGSGDDPGDMPAADGETSGADRQVYVEALAQIDSRRENLIRSAHDRIYSVIEDVAITNGYSLVLSENEVLYASEVYTDLTVSVIEQLNR